MSDVRASGPGSAELHLTVFPEITASPPLTHPGLRLVALHLLSRRAPALLAALAACGALLAAGLRWQVISSAPDAQRLIPALLEAGAASLVSLACVSPFGEPERATGRWLPWLRLATALSLTAASFGLLAAGAAAGRLPGDDLGLARDIGGIVGVGLLAAGVLGGSFAWIGPIAYVVLVEVALANAWQTPWIWPARPPGDHGAALCASLVFVAGIVVITVRGVRGSVYD